MHGRRAPAGVAAVHHVVVDQRARVQQLQRGGRAHHRLAVRAARAAPAPVAERRPQPLAAASSSGHRVQPGRSSAPAPSSTARCRARNPRRARPDLVADVPSAAGSRAMAARLGHDRGELRPRRGACRPGVATSLGPCGHARCTVPHDPRPAGEAGLVLLRVLPAQDRDGRAAALAGDPPARAAAADVRLGDVRRGRLDPGPHRPGHRADRRRDDADAGRPPHGGQPLGGRAAPGGRPVRRRGVRNVLALRGDPPGDPAGPSGHRTPTGCGTPTSWSGWSGRLGDFCVGVAAFPQGHPRSPDLDTDARVLRPEMPGGRRLRDHPDVLRRRGLPAAAGPGAAAGCTSRSSPGSCRSPAYRRSSGSRSCPGRGPAALAAGWTRSRTTRTRCARSASRSPPAVPAAARRGRPGLHFYTLNRSRRRSRSTTGSGWRTGRPAVARPQREHRSHHRVGRTGAREAVAGQQVGEAEAAVEAPGGGWPCGWTARRCAPGGPRPARAPRPADAAALIVRVHVHLGDLEGVRQPGGGSRCRAGQPGCRRPRRATTGRPAVEPVAEADERPPVARRGPAPVRVAALLTGLDRHHGAEGRVAGVALHDGHPAGQLGGWRGHRQRVDPGERVQFGGELLRTQFPQLRSGAHAGSVREVPACPVRLRRTQPVPSNADLNE